jgi:hypothetical protein
MEHIVAARSVSIQAGINNGPAIAADDLFAELDARYAETAPAPEYPRRNRKGG